ncbi:MAG: NAD(P) transhydrogenase subunit alpha [Candidatus Omnitrophota bacterium]|jgi:NAD(P) transhydrogenase subunit alpha
MIIGVVKETFPGENRVSLIPTSADKLIKKGAQIQIESGLGSSINISDEEYIKVGVTIKSRDEVLGSSDILMRLRKPEPSELLKIKKGAIHISFLDPFNEKELVNDFAKNNISAISIEMIPRTTLAQKMDALSSQANLAGYVTIILAAERLNKILPMMMTPSGTISPAHVFIIGAGVAGLQAIATAKRLGARVEAFDTRAVVEEQVQSLGAKFVKVDLGETGQTKDGYAKALTAEQMKMQQDAMAKVCAKSDIVVTTAQLFGRAAPTIITREMIASMKKGSIIVDMAVETGGNVEGSELDKEVVIDGVTVIGLGNLPGRVCDNASQMYSNNLTNLIESYWDVENKTFNLDLEDEIIKGCLITHKSELVNQRIKDFYTQ